MEQSLARAGGEHLVRIKAASLQLRWRQKRRRRLQPLKLCHTLNFIRKNVGASFKQLPERERDGESCKCSTCPASASALGAAGVANECCQSERQRRVRRSKRDRHTHGSSIWLAHWMEVASFPAQIRSACHYAHQNFWRGKRRVPPPPPPPLLSIGRAPSTCRLLTFISI